MMQQHLSNVFPVSLQNDFPSFIPQQQVSTNFCAAVQNSAGEAANAVVATSKLANVVSSNEFFMRAAYTLNLSPGSSRQHNFFLRSSKALIKAAQILCRKEKWGTQMRV